MDDVYVLLLRQRGSRTAAMDFAMHWEDLDQDVLATMPRKTRSLYQWDGSFAPYEGDIHPEVMSGDDQKSPADTKVSENQRRVNQLDPEAKWVEATWRPSWW